jgi:sigma-E factor negative regulatory protein RseC
MPRVGKIIEMHEDVALISMKANDGCDGCEACSHGANDAEQELEAINKLGAELGDTVEFDMEIPSLLSAAFIAYTVPLLTMVGSIMISVYSFRAIGMDKYSELLASIIGFTTLFLTYVVIRKFDTRMKESKRFLAVITRIVIKSKQEVF